MSLPKFFPIRAANGTTIQIPSVGYGTYAAGETKWAKDAVLAALKEGYRHLDCAWIYGVDEPIGEAIRESGIPREEIFITTKFWPHFGAPNNVELALDKILKNMGLDYVDLYLAHFPCVWKPVSQAALQDAISTPTSSNEDRGCLYVNGKPVLDHQYTTPNIAKQNGGQQGSFVPTWKAMQELVRKGKTKAVGLSNFSMGDIQDILPHEADVPISCNQIEVHPWLPQNQLIAFARANGILTTCYSPFAGQKKGQNPGDAPGLLQEDKVVALAEKTGMEVGQLLQSWAVQRNTVPLGKSATPARIRSNLAVRKLETADMEVLDALEVLDEQGRTAGTMLWGLRFYT